MILKKNARNDKFLQKKASQLLGWSTNTAIVFILRAIKLVTDV